MFQNPLNLIHQFFLELGVDLDFVPTSDYECFTMTLQFIAALWFAWWFVKYFLSFCRSLFTGGLR